MKMQNSGRKFENISYEEVDGQVNKKRKVIPDANGDLYNHYAVDIANEESTIKVDYVVSGFFSDIIKSLLEKQKSYAKLYNKNLYKCFSETFTLRVETTPSVKTKNTKTINFKVIYMKRKRVKVQIMSASKKPLCEIYITPTKVKVVNFIKYIAYLFNTTTDKVEIPVNMSLGILVDKLPNFELVTFESNGV